MKTVAVMLAVLAAGTTVWATIAQVGASRSDGDRETAVAARAALEAEIARLTKEVSSLTSRAQEAEIQKSAADSFVVVLRKQIAGLEVGAKEVEGLNCVNLLRADKALKQGDEAATLRHLSQIANPSRADQAEVKRIRDASDRAHPKPKTVPVYVHRNKSLAPSKLGSVVHLRTKKSILKITDLDCANVLNTHPTRGDARPEGQIALHVRTTFKGQTSWDPLCYENFGSSPLGVQVGTWGAGRYGPYGGRRFARGALIPYARTLAHTDPRWPAPPFKRRGTPRRPRIHLHRAFERRSQARRGRRP